MGNFGMLKVRVCCDFPRYMQNGQSLLPKPPLSYVVGVTDSSASSCNHTQCRRRGIAELCQKGEMMSHMTRKKKRQREKNNRKRAFNGFDTGTRSMGFESNQARKDYLFRILAKQ